MTIQIIQKHGDPPSVKSWRPYNTALEAAFKIWLRVRLCSEHTRRSYMYVVRDFADFLRSENVLEVSHLTIRQYMARLAGRQVSSHTVAQRLSALRTFFKSCAKAV